MNTQSSDGILKIVSHLRLPPQTNAYINRVVQQPPSRNVSNRTGRNVIVDFSSKKMGHTIAVESYSVEGAYAFILEFDRSVVGYFPQPEPITLDLTDIRGFKRKIHKTFDFLVVYRDRIEIVECKPAEWLRRAAEDKPFICKLGTDGQWRAPEIEPQIEALGLVFRYVDNATIPKALIRNLTILEQIRDLAYSSEHALACILARFDLFGAQTLASLITDCEGYQKNDVFAAVLKGDVYFDLVDDLLCEPSVSKVFLTRGKWEVSRLFQAIPQGNSTTGIILEGGTKLIWHTQSYRVASITSTGVDLLDASGAVVFLKHDALSELLKSGHIHVEDQKAKSAPDNNTDLGRLLSKISDEQFRSAANRAEFVKARLRDPKADPDRFGLGSIGFRQIQRWTRDFSKAVIDAGNGLFGLFPKLRRGNKKDRLPVPVISVMQQIAKDNYLTVTRPTIEHCYRLLCLECEVQKIHVPTRKTFSRFLKRCASTEESVLAREGSRRAYRFDYESPNEQNWITANDFPEKYAQIDATELDIQLVSSESCLPLGRPWLTLLHSPLLRAPWSFVLSFDRPNSRDVLLLYRECYARWKQLPQFIGADNGREFENANYDRLLAAFELHKVTRPPAKARFGSSIESYFRRVHAECIYNLKGNSQNSKNVRQQTAETSPIKNAIWTLPALHEHLEEYFFNTCWNSLAPEIHNTPMRELERRRALSPDRSHRFCISEEDVRLLFMPDKPNGMAKVHAGRGVWVFGYYYWNEAFRNPIVEGTRVQVRYEPYDLGSVSAYVGEAWLECVGRNIPEILNFTEKQCKLVAYERRYLKSKYQSLRDADRGRQLAIHARLAENKEQQLIQQKRDAEAAVIRKKKQPAMKTLVTTAKKLRAFDFSYLRSGKPAA